jgi:hypothetical protein
MKIQQHKKSFILCIWQWHKNSTTTKMFCYFCIFDSDMKIQQHKRRFVIFVYLTVTWKFNNTTKFCYFCIFDSDMKIQQHKKIFFYISTTTMAAWHATLLRYTYIACLALIHLSCLSRKRLQLYLSPLKHRAALYVDTKLLSIQYLS